MTLDESITTLKGIGTKTAALFARIGVTTVEELINHYPREYEAFAEPVAIKDATFGEVCALYAAVSCIPSQKRIRNLTILNVLIQDNTGAVQLTFFNMPYLKKMLKPGGYYVFRGLVQSRGNGKIMEQPKIYSLEEYRRQCGQLMPQYSLTKGLSNQTVQRAMRQALSVSIFEKEYYSEKMRHQYRLISQKDAIEQMHFPTDYDELKAARRRLVFDEFFDFLYILRQNKELSQKLPNSYPMLETADTLRFVEQLPFPLTKAQRRVWGELREDMAGNCCMNRLIQGDVGSGKTILALLALLMCVANGFQGALMAPTEVLAIQHFNSVLAYTEQYHLIFRPVLLVGSMTTSQKKEVYARIASGEANLIIGTHALIQDKVQYHKLALVVTDEQHRFGVRQRERLADKGKENDSVSNGSQPHVLVMSATPIPRTLAVILYGDLHVSIVDELPAERLPIKNCVVNTAYRPKAYTFIAKEVAAGRQAYVICPQVEEGENGELENVVDYTGKLKAVLPPSVQVAYLHGKMSPSDKKQIMEDFSAHNIDVLVSTTVIEVGINVPNATVMMVENAERFGLAQLHQLRGRVGRGEHQSYCIFISTNEKKETMERLEILNKSNDGFWIAAQDLKLRGPGELFGVRQSGELSFKIADIYTDADVLSAASDAVEQILSDEPEMAILENEALIEHYNKKANVVDFRSI